MSSKLLLAVLSLPLCCNAGDATETTNQSWLEQSRWTIGVSLKSVDFDIYPEGSLNAAGTLSEDFHTTPFITLSGPPAYFGDSPWGWFIEYSLSQFALNRQLINDQLIDLGTSMTGYDVYIAPTLFYRFDTPNLVAGEHDRINAGLGAGLGYLKASGSVILTASGGKRLAVDISNAGLAIVIFVEYLSDHFRSRIAGGGTSYTSNGLEYEAFGFEWSFGYSF